MTEVIFWSIAVTIAYVFVGELELKFFALSVIIYLYGLSVATIELARVKSRENNTRTDRELDRKGSDDLYGRE